MVVERAKRVSRDDVERVVKKQSAKQELRYRVVWSAAAASKKPLALTGVAFKAPLLSGATFDMGAHLGKKPIVLTFWASWCAPCIKEAPHLARLYRRYGKQGVVFAAVSIDAASDHAKLRKVVAAQKLPYPVPLDPNGEVLAKYGRGASIPLTFVISRTGAVAYAHQNFKPGDEGALENAIKGALAR